MDCFSSITHGYHVELRVLCKRDCLWSDYSDCKVIRFQYKQLSIDYVINMLTTTLHHIATGDLLIEHNVIVSILYSNVYPMKLHLQFKPCVCVRVRVCVRVCEYVCVYMCVMCMCTWCTCTCVCLCAFMRPCVCMCVFVRACVRPQRV